MKKEILPSEKLDNLVILNKLNNEKINWYEIYRKYKLEENSIKEYCDDIFNFIVYNDQLNMYGLFLHVIPYINFNNKLNFVLLKMYISMKRITKSDIEKIISCFHNNRLINEIINHFIVCGYQIDEQFLEKYIDNLDFGIISSYLNLSENFMDKYQDKLNWNNLIVCQVLSERFMEKHINKINWNLIGEHQRLSEKFIEKYSNEINWDDVSMYQKLSEDFMTKFQNKVDWNLISEYQYLSELFIEKFQDKVNWELIFKNQKLSNKFRKQFRNKIN